MSPMGDNLDMRVQVICGHCGKAYELPPCRVRRSGTNYCSVECHNAASRQTSDPVERFWSKVEKTDGGCWLWQAARISGGYGVMGIRGGQRNVLAHRFSWELHRGPIPDEFFVCHRCDNPSCVRPDHLFIGTALDNSRDMMNKGRHYRAHRFACKHGHHFDRRASAGHRACSVCMRRHQEKRNSRKRNGAAHHRWLVVHGERMTLAEAARRFGVKAQTIRYRLSRHLSAEAAVAMEVRHGKRLAA